ncbi:Germin-like protein 9-3 [Apostasia shenzhenica]|uniref:Germin-like protein n=1 Tax=Apostasia shenzhenica TaxID=1088818 RepID=A0A2I0B5E6_9ASPA|nr:Germin-like protein 9-3 [Apostasia shenzhenica]
MAVRGTLVLLSALSIILTAHAADPDLYRGTLVLLSALSIILTAHAADPDLYSDFVAPNGTTVDAGFFTFRGLNNSLSDSPKVGAFNVTKASQIEFPALIGQSVSYAVLQFGPFSVNTPHIHPRSAELLLVLQGTLYVGFIDTSNKLFSKLLLAGDLFVFPKGLVHYQYNHDPKYSAIAISAFGSADAGIVSLPKTIFRSGIDRLVLAQSFKVDAGVIDQLASANVA